MTKEKVLLDSSFIIKHTQKGDFHFEGLGELHVSIITLGELSDKFVKEPSSAQQKRISKVLLKCKVVELTKREREILDTYAVLSQFMKKQTTHKRNKKVPLYVGQNDIWIVASAAVKNIPLLTQDNKQRELYTKFMLSSQK